MAKISKKSSKAPYCVHNWEKFFICGSFSLDRCSKCTLIKTVNKLKTLKQYSNTDIEHAVMQYWIRGDEYRKFAKQFIDFLPNKKGKLLDVGCGLGWFVAEANSRGFKAVGADPNKAMVNYGKKYVDPNLVAEPFEKYFTKEKFDYITLSHVIEHIPDLHSFLQKIQKHLKPGGMLLITTPNIDSLMFKIFKCRWYPMHPTEHVWQFTPKSLSFILKSEDFKINKLKLTSMSYNPKNIFKNIAFKFLNALANLINKGDQIFLLVEKK